jgi:membrane protease YdiL (CAAX protease family)
MIFAWRLTFDAGWFLSIGYDSLAGIASLLSYIVLSKARNRIPKPSEITTMEEVHPPVHVEPPARLVPYTALPPLLEDPYYDNLPWNVTTYRAEAWRVLSSKNLTLRSPGATKDHNISNAGEVKDSDHVVSEPVSLTGEEWQVLEDVEEITNSAKFTGLFLVVGYTLTGQVAIMCEGFLYCLAGLGVPMSIAMHRSLVVLISHLCWVFAGSTILSSDLYPSFFGHGPNSEERRKRQDKAARLWPWQRTQNVLLSEQDGQEKDSAMTATTVQIRPPFWRNTTSEWFTNKWNTSWVWWVIGGYFISSWCFNLSDILNQLILPASIFENAGEGVVAQLINPEQNDLWASLVGYIAPCLSAPIWEELLYRGYMLPALSLFVPFWPAVFTSGLLFSVHHMSTAGFIPLWVLGMAWATLYAKCKNLWVTILIHAMWNSRVFLGSWLGL